MTNHILSTKLILSQFEICANKPEVYMIIDFSVLEGGHNQS